MTQDLGGEPQEEMKAIEAGTFGAAIQPVLCSASLEAPGDRVKDLNKTTTSEIQIVLCMNFFFLVGALGCEPGKQVPSAFMYKVVCINVYLHISGSRQL